MNTNFSFNIMRGRIKKFIIINIILFFLIYQALFFYGIKVFFYESNNPEYSYEYKMPIQDTEQEIKLSKLFQKIISDGNSLYNNFPLVNNNEKIKFWSEFSETVENNLINNIISAPDAENILGIKKIIVSDTYKFNHLRATIKLLNEYCEFQVAKGEKLKAIAAINSMISLCMFSYKGNGGTLSLISGMISIALSGITTEAINHALNSNKITFTADELSKLADKLKKMSEVSNNFFDYMECEKNIIKETIGKYLMIQYNKNIIKMISSIAALKTLDLYYGSFFDQYESLMNSIIILKNKPYSEVKAYAEFSEQILVQNSNILNSKYHPLVLVTIPNYKRAYIQYLVSILRLKGLILKTLALKIKTATGKIPNSIDEIITASNYDNSKFEISTDDFSQKKLNYKVSETGEIIIYSTGPDMKDNGGTFSEKIMPPSELLSKDGIDLKL